MSMSLRHMVYPANPHSPAHLYLSPEDTLKPSSCTRCTMHSAHLPPQSPPPPNICPLLPPPSSQEEVAKSSQAVGGVWGGWVRGEGSSSEELTRHTTLPPPPAPAPGINTWEIHVSRGGGGGKGVTELIFLFLNSIFPLNPPLSLVWYSFWTVWSRLSQKDLVFNPLLLVFARRIL
jgi:hypothetical protein